NIGAYLFSEDLAFLVKKTLTGVSGSNYYKDTRELHRYCFCLPLIKPGKGSSITEGACAAELNLQVIVARREQIILKIINVVNYHVMLLRLQ
ncbi:hypothetical protein AHS81_25025, partial [Salmonella enterica]|nr:hypothetical protein [Salmonella enterica]